MLTTELAADRTSRRYSSVRCFRDEPRIVPRVIKTAAIVEVLPIRPPTIAPVLLVSRVVMSTGGTVADVPDRSSLGVHWLLGT